MQDIAVLEVDVCALALADVDSLSCRNTLGHKYTSSRAFVYGANVPIHVYTKILFYKVDVEGRRRGAID